MVTEFERNKIKLMLSLNPKSDKFNRLKYTLTVEAFILLSIHMDYRKWVIWRKKFEPKLITIIEEQVLQENCFMIVY